MRAVVVVAVQKRLHVGRQQRYLFGTIFYPAQALAANRTVEALG